MVRTLGGRHSVAGFLKSLGDIALYLDEREAARAHFEESRSIYQELGDRMHLAAPLRGLGNVALRQGDAAAARALYEEALVIERSLGSRRGIADSLCALGNVVFHQGDPAAQAFYAEALAIWRDLGNKRCIAECLEGLAGAAGARGQGERAARLFGAAAALREQISAPVWPADRGDYERRVAAAQAALGGPGPGFAAAWTAGQALLLEEAVAEAFHEDLNPL
jgi:tetratricopeptide (TPR) repeat protein